MNSQKPNITLIILAAAVALLSAAAGVSLWTFTRAQQAPATQVLMVLPESREIGDFSLVDQDGEPFGPDRLTGRWTLIFFGFTHCPDVCPGTLYDLRLVNERLAQSDDASAAGHQVLFVSVDPERDSPDKLKQYVHHFDPAFIAATGSHDQLAPLTRQLGIAYRIEPHEEGSAHYGVDHSASILLTGPDGRLHGVFPAPHDAGLISSDLAAVLN